jgi:phytanoyl-CoA hydroxylase
MVPGRYPAHHDGLIQIDPTELWRPMVSQSPTIAFDHEAEEHGADLYLPDAEAPLVADLESVDEAQAFFYREFGFLAVQRAFDQRQVSEARQALRDIIRGDRQAPPRCQVMYEAVARDSLQTLSLDQRELAVRKVFRFEDVDPRLDAVMRSPALLTAVAKLGCTDPQLFQTMALLKGPGGREKPWHQDHAYFNVDLRHRVVGVWIALDQATPANGCMHIMPGRHRQPVIHFKRRDWQICDATARSMHDQVLAVALEPGGLLFFDSLLPHGTPTNRTNDRRQALQFHYAPAERVAIATEQRLEIFGSEGKNVEC